MRRPLRVCALSLGLIAAGAVACDQILGNGDFEVEGGDAGVADGSPNDSQTTITNPVDVTTTTPTDSASPVTDAGLDADADATVYPDAAAFPDGAVVWQPAAGGNGHGYLVIVSGTSIDWDDANTGAQAAGGHLVTVTSLDENSFVIALAVDAGGSPSGKGPWLGGLQGPDAVEPDGGWMWVTGEPWSFTSWGDGEPNNQGGAENWLSYYPDEITGAPAWNDYDQSGDDSVIAYVVEFE